EDRLAPAVTSMVDGLGKPTIAITPGGVENVSITTAAGTVQINGANPGSGAALSSAIKAIAVTGDANANIVDLSGVHTADFTQLGSIVIDAGGGNDTITGSEFADAVVGGAADGAVTLTDGALTVITGSTETDTLTSIERAVLTGRTLDDSGFTGQVVFNSG